MADDKVNLDADGLMPRQAAFVREYLISRNGAAAAIAAGYSSKGASVRAVQLLANGKVKAALDRHIKAAEAKTETEAEWVLRSLKTVAERCMQAEPVMIMRDGVLVQKTQDGEPLFQFNPNGANKALELIGKHNRLFVDRIEHSGEITMIVDTGVPSGD